MKKQMIWAAAVLFFIFTLSSTHLAQEGRGNGRITGVVLDENNNPLQGVEILLESTTYNFKLETKSDKSGKWGFLGFSRGPFKFTFAKESYLTVNATLMLSGVNKNPDQRIIMKKGEPIPKGKIKASETVKADFKKANTLFAEKKYAEAAPYFEAIIEKNPKFYKMHINLANCMMELKEYTRAIEEYNKFLEGLKGENPDLKGNKKASEVYANIGSAYMSQDKFDEAVENYKKSIEITPPTDAAVAYNLAEIFFSANNVDEAIKYYKLAAKLRPDFAGYYKKLGYAYLNKGDISSAKTYFLKFIEMDPDDPETPTIKEMLNALQ